MPEPARATSDVGAIAARLLGRAVQSAEPAAPGGNNRVYRIDTKDGAFALKFYPSQDDDRRDRLSQEYQGLEFLARYGIAGIPRPVARDPALGCGLYEWIDGVPIAGARVEPGPADVDAMVALAGRLAALADESHAGALAPASAHCFSGAAVAAQLAERLARLHNVAAKEDALAPFLDDEFAPRVEPLLRRAKDVYAEASLDFGTELRPPALTLSPSDFGFHNALRTRDGGIAFVDFEYFGWDDPAKMVSDALWHPGSTFSPTLARRFRVGAGRIFEDREGDSFAVRLEALHPLFGMIWCLILLNEFLPERWRRRLAAGGTADAGPARARQLAAARRLLAKVTEIADE